MALSFQIQVGSSCLPQLARAPFVAEGGTGTSRKSRQLWTVCRFATNNLLYITRAFRCMLIQLLEIPACSGEHLTGRGKARSDKCPLLQPVCGARNESKCKYENSHCNFDYLARWPAIKTIWARQVQPTLVNQHNPHECPQSHG